MAARNEQNSSSQSSQLKRKRSSLDLQAGMEEEDEEHVGPVGIEYKEERMKRRPASSGWLMKKRPIEWCPIVIIIIVV